MRKFLLGDFDEGDRVILADGRDAVVVRLEDADHIRVETADGRDVAVRVADVIGRERRPPA